MINTKLLDTNIIKLLFLAWTGIKCECDLFDDTENDCIWFLKWPAYMCTDLNKLNAHPELLAISILHLKMLLDGMYGIGYYFTICKVWIWAWKNLVWEREEENSRKVTDMYIYTNKCGKVIAYIMRNELDEQNKEQSICPEFTM